MSAAAATALNASPVLANEIASGGASPSNSQIEIAPARPAKEQAQRNGLDFAPVGSTSGAGITVLTAPRPAAPVSAVAPRPTDVVDPAPTIEPPLPPDIPPSTADIAPALDGQTPLQSAVEAAIGARAARDDKINPLGGGDWRAARAAILAAYAGRGFTPIWVSAHGLSPTGRSALARLKQADQDGLDLSAFALPSGSARDLSVEKLAEIEANIAAAVVVYAEQASGSRVNPSRVSKDIGARPDVADATHALLAVAAADDPGRTLGAFNPPGRAYELLREELSRLDAAEAPPGAHLPEGPPLRLGMTDSRVPLIRARLGLDLGEPQDSTRYDRRVASAVAAFQRVNGLAVDGVVSAATGRALEAGPETRRREAIVSNMEMWRWQPRDLGERRIEVNVADYSLTMSDGDSVIHRARVIVGKPDTPTPIFSNSIKYITVNPSWKVPQSIIKKEMLPRLAADPDYLTRHGYKVTKIGDRLEVEQPPGEANALGRILFMFPNDYAVYLHDTPSRGLFASDRRALSHGCVRVEKPLDLAELVMGGADQSWTARRFAAALGRSEESVPLRRPVPIHLEYFTEFVDEDGALQEREDIYGLTRRVASILFNHRQD